MKKQIIKKGNSSHIKDTSLRRDESFERFRDLKFQINTVIRNITSKFNFENYTNEKLQPLEIVR